MQYGGLWSRATAILIDTIAGLSFYTLLTFLPNVSFFYENIIYQLACATYFIGFTASKFQASPGQLAMKLKVGDTQQRKLSPLQSLLRYFVWGIPAWPLVGLSSLPVVSKIIEEMEHVASDDLGAFLSSPEVALQITNLGVSFLVLMVGGLIWWLPIAFSKEKTGIHDLICGQRVFKN